jgi:hypothetical protein
MVMMPMKHIRIVTANVTQSKFLINLRSILIIESGKGKGTGKEQKKQVKVKEG